jgi:hypothetical protein
MALPGIAEPIRPGELVASWIERAARATGLPAARLRQYWWRKVDAPRAVEYVAIIGAAEAAARRRQAVADLEQEIAARAAQLAADHDRLVADHPVLARLAPAPPRETVAAQAAPVTAAPRRGGA